MPILLKYGVNLPTLVLSSARKLRTAPTEKARLMRSPHDKVPALFQRRRYCTALDILRARLPEEREGFGPPHQGYNMPASPAIPIYRLSDRLLSDKHLAKIPTARLILPFPSVSMWHPVHKNRHVFTLFSCVEDYQISSQRHCSHV